MQEQTNTYMIVLKTTVYLYHLYLAFSSAKIFFPTIFLKNSQTNKLQKTHTIPSVCFTFSFQIAFSLLFYSKPRWQHTFLKHKRNPCTGNNLQFYFFFQTPSTSPSHLTWWAAAQHPQESKAFEHVDTIIYVI